MSTPTSPATDPDITVIICTHNPRMDYLTRAIAALRAQTLPVDRWELLIIDNASTEPVASRVDLAWHPSSRIIPESSLGLTPARLRGILESRGGLLVFVDDDNVLRPDYLAVCLRIAADHPLLGAWGGSCLPEYETPPPAEIGPWLGGLAVHKLNAPVWAKFRSVTEACPCGAGMALRRNVALRYRELAMNDPLRQALDRSGEALGAGGDSDMALCGFELGLGTGCFPELELTHLIAAKKLTLEYIAGIYEGFGYATIVLGVLHQPGYDPGIKEGPVTSLRICISKILLLRKSRAERRIALANQRGRMKAHRKLKTLGYFQPGKTANP